MIDFKKHKHLLLDIIIGILIVLIIILIDLAFTRFKSNTAEEKNLLNLNKQVAESPEMIKIQVGENVFLPILNFHHIGQAPAKASAVTKSFYVEPERFEAILKDLTAEGYKSIFVSQAVDYLTRREMPKDKIMAITFDDGNEDFYTTAWPILKKYNMKSSIYVMTGVRGESWLTKEQIVELDMSGLVEIGSHTVWHPYLTRVSAEQQYLELKDSKDYLEKLLGKTMLVICYPFGLYNQQIEARAKEIGYQAGLTFDQDAWQNPDDLFELKRISIYPGLDISKFLNKIKNPSN